MLSVLYTGRASYFGNSLPADCSPPRPRCCAGPFQITSSDWIPDVATDIPVSHRAFADATSALRARNHVA
jgi:hypothetical protein